MARAIYVGISGGRLKQGASTISQQLARTIFLNNSRTMVRKAREAILALAMERKFSKDEVLELYLNRVYFGGGALRRGFRRRKFFGHPATGITLSEGAIIAGLVKAPSNFSPTADAKAAVGGANVVLSVIAGSMHRLSR